MIKKTQKTKTKGQLNEKSLSRSPNDVKVVMLATGEMKYTKKSCKNTKAPIPKTLKAHTQLNIDHKITERVFSKENRSLESILSTYCHSMIEKKIKTMYDEKEVRAISKKEVA